MAVPNITLVPTRKSEALLLAAQRGRWASERQTRMKTPERVSEKPISWWLKTLTVGQLWALGTALVALVVGAFATGYWTATTARELSAPDRVAEARSKERDRVPVPVPNGLNELRVQLLRILSEPNAHSGVTLDYLAGKVGVSLMRVESELRELHKLNLVILMLDHNEEPYRVFIRPEGVSLMSDHGLYD